VLNYTRISKYEVLVSQLQYPISIRRIQSEFKHPQSRLRYRYMTMPNRNCRPKSNNRKTTPAI